jgi:CheY-like chemotaxis protein
VVEGSGFENRRTLTGTRGSNPFFSANPTTRNALSHPLPRAGGSPPAVWVRARACNALLSPRAGNGQILGRTGLSDGRLVPYLDEMLPSRAVGAKVKVLVVDDDAVVLEAVREWLEGGGYEVVVRQQSLGTARWVSEEQPDYVLLDVSMPGLSGGEIAKLIRQNHSTAHTGVILFSSMPDHALTELARSTGAVGGLQKTSNSRLFLAGFGRLVAQHRANGRSK